MSALDTMFASLKKEGRKAIAPFFTVGDPDPEFTIECVRAIDRAGADLCELGVPYSDPLADGPVIQASYTRALEKGLSLDNVLETSRTAVSKVSMPLVAMVSYSIIYRRGIDRFVGNAVDAGLSGLVVPDLPIEEADELDRLCRQRDLGLVRLVAPTTPQERALAIVRKATGFVYCVSVSGITGERRELPADLLERIEWLREKSNVPILVGFGISSPEQVRSLCKVADGVIVGSAIVRHLSNIATTSRSHVIGEIEAHVRTLVAAVRETN